MFANISLYYFLFSSTHFLGLPIHAYFKLLRIYPTPSLSFLPASPAINTQNSWLLAKLASWHATCPSYSCRCQFWYVGVGNTNMSFSASVCLSVCLRVRLSLSQLLLQSNANFDIWHLQRRISKGIVQQRQVPSEFEI